LPLPITKIAKKDTMKTKSLIWVDYFYPN